MCKREGETWASKWERDRVVGVWCVDKRAKTHRSSHRNPLLHMCKYCSVCINSSEIGKWYCICFRIPTATAAAKAASLGQIGNALCKTGYSHKPNSWIALENAVKPKDTWTEHTTKSIHDSELRARFSLPKIVLLIFLGCVFLLLSFWNYIWFGVWSACRSFRSYRFVVAGSATAAVVVVILFFYYIHFRCWFGRWWLLW